MGIGSLSCAIKALYGGVKTAPLSDNEKHIVKTLIEKLMIYYTNRYNEIEKGPIDYGYDLRQSRLYSEIVDYIVAINSVIEGNSDVYQVVNTIYKEINYDKAKGKFKRKRLI